MEKVKAALLRRTHEPLEIVEVGVDAPGPREVAVDVRAVGLCRSDMHFIEGAYPHPLPVVLGHEAAGVVAAIGSEVTDFAVGDRVVSFLVPFCGTCALCMNGQQTLCQSDSVKRADGAPPRLTLGGEPLVQFLNLSAFAERMLVHENALVRVGDDIPLDRAALIGCAVVTGAGAVFREARLEPGESVAVIGAGGIGLSAINAARIAGAGRIVAIDLNPAKLELARKFGATDAFVVEEGVDKAVAAATGGGVDHAIEAVGRTDTTELAWNILRRGGQAIVLGMIPPGANVTIHGPTFLAGKGIKGSLMGGAHFRTDMPRLVDHYLAGRLDLDSIIAERVPLERINEAVERMRGGGDAVRSVVTMEG